MDTAILISTFETFTQLLDYMVEVQKAYADMDLHEHSNYTIDIFYREREIVNPKHNYKIKITLYEEKRRNF